MLTPEQSREIAREVQSIKDIDIIETVASLSTRGDYETAKALITLWKRQNQR